ncbi:hypothetical protein J4216_00265 [Candidatus Woesearchaeota archaeon]|nr:hypothetical protein [Candidatus Woesearchaeota archaeon]
MGKKSLEQRAKELLISKINGTAPNSRDLKSFSEELGYLVGNGYVSKFGETPKSLNYNVTDKGRLYASQK